MMHCWQGLIDSATSMAFFSASDRSQRQSQQTSRQCSCRFDPTTRQGLSPFSVDRGWQWKDLQIQSTHFWSHMLIFLCDICSAEVCKWPQTGTSRGPHLNHATSSTWMISCRPTLLKRRPKEVQMRSKLFCIQEDSIWQIPEQQTSHIRKPTGRRQGGNEIPKNLWSDVGLRNWQVDVCKTEASLHRTTALSKKSAFNGSFSVWSSWTDFTLCHQN